MSKKISEIFNYIVPDCSKDIVPLDREDYMQILVNTSQGILNEIAVIMENELTTHAQLETLPEQPSLEQPSLGQSSLEQPSLGQSSLGQSSLGQSSLGQSSPPPAQLVPIPASTPAQSVHMPSEQHVSAQQVPLKIIGWIMNRELTQKELNDNRVTKNQKGGGNNDVWKINFLNNEIKIIQQFINKLPNYENYEKNNEYYIILYDINKKNIQIHNEVEYEIVLRNNFLEMVSSNNKNINHTFEPNKPIEIILHPHIYTLSKNNNNIHENLVIPVCINNLSNKLNKFEFHMIIGILKENMSSYNINRVDNLCANAHNSDNNLSQSAASSVREILNESSTQPAPPTQPAPSAPLVTVSAQTQPASAPVQPVSTILSTSQSDISLLKKSEIINGYIIKRKLTDNEQSSKKLIKGTDRNDSWRINFLGENISESAQSAQLTASPPVLTEPSNVLININYVKEIISKPTHINNTNDMYNIYKLSNQIKRENLSNKVINWLFFSMKKNKININISGVGSISNLFNDNNPIHGLKFRIQFDNNDTLNALPIILNKFKNFVDSTNNTEIHSKIYIDYNNNTMQCGKIFDFFINSDLKDIETLVKEIYDEFKKNNIKPIKNCKMLYPENYVKISPGNYKGSDKNAYMTNYKYSKLEYKWFEHKGYDFSFRWDIMDQFFYKGGPMSLDSKFIETILKKCSNDICVFTEVIKQKKILELYIDQLHNNDIYILATKQLTEIMALSTVPESAESAESVQSSKQLSTSPIKILTYNVWHDAMMGNKGKDRRNNILNVIKARSTYDFIALQEATRTDPTYNNIPELKDMGYINHHYELEQMTTFYNKNRYTLTQKFLWGFEDGRPFQVLVFSNQKLVFINVHPGHIENNNENYIFNGDTKKNARNKGLTYALENVYDATEKQSFWNRTSRKPEPIYPDFPVKVDIDLSNYRFIIAGDFNYNINNLHIPYKKKHIIVNNVQKDDDRINTCCNPTNNKQIVRKDKYDHILDSEQNSLVKYNIAETPNIDLFNQASDHLPIEVELRRTAKQQGGDNMCDTVRIEPVNNNWTEFKPNWLLDNCLFMKKNELVVGDFGEGGDCQFLSIAAGLNIGKFNGNENYTCSELRNAIGDYVEKLDVNNDKDREIIINKIFINVYNDVKYTTFYQKEQYNIIETYSQYQNSSENLRPYNSDVFNEQLQSFINNYVKAVKTPGYTYWGDNTTLLLLTNIYKNLGFIILSEDNESIIIIPGDIDNQNKKYLMLYYVNSNHYQLIKRKNNNDLLSVDDVVKIQEECVGEKGNKPTTQQSNISTQQQILSSPQDQPSQLTPEQSEQPPSSSQASQQHQPLSIAHTNQSTTSTLNRSRNSGQLSENINEISDQTILEFRHIDVQNSDGLDINVIKKKSMDILIRKYTELLDSFIEEEEIVGGNSGNEQRIVEIYSCFNALSDGTVVDNCIKTDYEDYMPKLRFTNGVITYMRRMDNVFKKDIVELNREDRKFLENIPKNINMIVAVMYYVIEQIYSFKVDLSSESKRVMVDYVLVRKIQEPQISSEPQIVPENIRYIALPIVPKYIALPLKESMYGINPSAQNKIRYIALPIIPKYIAIPLEESHSGIISAKNNIKITKTKQQKTGKRSTVISPKSRKYKEKLNNSGMRKIGRGKYQK